MDISSGVQMTQSGRQEIDLPLTIPSAGVSLMLFLIFKMQEYRKVSSCSRSPSCNQVLSYAIVCLLTVAFYLIIVPRLQPRGLQVGLASAFGVLLAAVALSTLQTSCIDPADPVMVAFRRGSRGEISSVIRECLFCESCKSYVKSTSRHCRVCNRCVQGFDHHCIWINNCIGQSNYCWFFTMLVAVCNLFLVFVATVPLVQADAHATAAPMIFLWALEALAIFALLPLLLLLVFHIYLYCHGTSTYDFFTAKNKVMNSNTLETQPNLWEAPSQILEVRGGERQIPEDYPQKPDLQDYSFPMKENQQGQPVSLKEVSGKRAVQTQMEERNCSRSERSASRLKSRIRSASIKILCGQGLEVEQFEILSQKQRTGLRAKNNIVSPPVASQLSSDIHNGSQ